MCRNIPDPGVAGGFEVGVRVETTGDGTVDNGLLLLVQQSNQFPLGTDKAVDFPIRVVQKSHDGGLFVGRWEERFDAAKIIRIKPETAFDYSGGSSFDPAFVKRQPK